MQKQIAKHNKRKGNHNSFGNFHQPDWTLKDQGMMPSNFPGKMIFSFVLYSHPNYQSSGKGKIKVFSHS